MKISVLTPSYNSGTYLEKSINSVLSQSYTNWEHIIVDGLSTDNTKDILDKYTHLKWVSEPDQGQSDAMNKAFGLSTGDVIVYLNADDYFYPDAFEIFISNFQKHPDVDMVVGNLDVDREGVIRTNTNATVSWKKLSVIQGLFPLNPVSYAYKREVQDKVGAFPINEHYTMDYWFLLRAFYLFKPLKITDVMGCFVFVENNKSSTIASDFEIQKPHALRFCLKYTPLRLFYVTCKLFVHPKNESVLKTSLLKVYQIIKPSRQSA